MDTPQPQEFVPQPAAKSRGWLTHLCVIASLGTLVLLAFSNTVFNIPKFLDGMLKGRVRLEVLNTEFALDNKFIIIDDPRLRVANWDNLKLIFSEDYWFPKAVSGLYRPLTTLSYSFNYSVLRSGEKAASYHWVNLVVHWLNAVLVYFLVLVLMDNRWPALLTALLFAAHPIVTESVTNIVGRADLFAMAAVLGGFLCYVKSTAAQGCSKLPWLVALAAVTTLGVFCKESAVVVLPVMLLYDVTFPPWQRTKNWMLNVWGYVAVLPPLVGMFLVRRAVFGRLRPPELPFVDNPLIDLSFWEARLTAIKVVGKYFWLLLWPAHLSCDYSYNQIPLVHLPLRGWEDGKSVAALALVMIILALAVLSYRRQKPAFFFIAFFFLTFLPSSNLVPNPTFGLSLWDNTAWCIGSIMAERFLYLPSIAYAGLTVIVVYALWRKLVARLGISPQAQQVWLPVVARSLLCLLAVGYGIRTFFRNYDWNDDVRLWTNAAVVCPNSFKSHKSLAYALYEKDPQGRNIDRIIEEGEQAAKITDRAQIVFLHLGAYYRIKGDLLSLRGANGSLVPTHESVSFYQKSIERLRRAVPLDRAFNDENRAKQLKRGRQPEDIPDVGNHDIYGNLGVSYTRIGLYDAARDAYLYMRHLSPTNPDPYVNLANVSLAQNKLDDAAVYLLQALLFDKNRQEVTRGLFNIYRQIDREGNAITVSPNAQGQPALNLNSALVHNHLCAAYLNLLHVFIQAKQYELAQATRKSALEIYNCSPAPFDQAIANIPPSKRKP